MIEIVEGDITTLAVDAIVNAANPELWPGGGVSGAIHAAAGPALHEEQRRRYPAGCPTGEAVVTGGHGLPARHVIHAVGPQWLDGGPDRDALLERTYRNVFARARELGARSIAFPAISTGIYRFPKDRAAAIAVRVMREEEPHFDRIVVALFGDENVRIYERSLASTGGKIADEPQQQRRPS